MTAESVFGSLTGVHGDEGGWPSRIGKFMAGLADRHAAHPSLSHLSGGDVASFLPDVFESEFPNHGPSIDADSFHAAGRAENAVDFHITSSVDHRNPCGTLAMAAFEGFAFELAA